MKTPGVAGVGGVYAGGEPDPRTQFTVMNFTPHKVGTWPRFAAGWCALLLYAGACSPLGVGLAALIGSFDPNHQLLSGRSECGLRMVLHHASHGLSHQHGLAARALALFALPANAATPDHILQFSSADTLKGDSRRSAPEPDFRNALLGFRHSDFLAHAGKLFVSGISPGFLVEGTPARLCLRSTVLLI